MKSQESALLEEGGAILVSGGIPNSFIGTFCSADRVRGQAEKTNAAPEVAL